MGQGLGRNSPVQLSLGKDNYCALIERHGQWIRWHTASKCSCVKMPSMQPDIHCKICGGRGVTYTYQKDMLIAESVMASDTSGILECSERLADGKLVEVYDYNGTRYKNAQKLDNYIYLNSSSPIQKGTYYTIVVKQDNLKILEKTECQKGEIGFYLVPGLMNQKPNIDGVYYGAPSDIIAIGKITDANGVEYAATELRMNQFRIEPTTETVTDEETGEEIEVPIPIEEPVTVENVVYLPPFIFAILNQNISKADAQAIVEAQGDAIVTFPYECDVAVDDVLTVLVGTNTNKEVLIRSEYETDTIGVYFVHDIVSITGISEEKKEFEYVQGVDYVLVGTNKIKWLESGNYPDEGDTYSITYHYLPTYKVVKDIPQLRTSENQRFPKKAVVKLFSSYSENLGVNRQSTIRNGFAGMY